MLEVRKNTYVKSYENSFFRKVSRHLSRSFKERNINGVLIGSPLCEADERLQIDALLITPNVVCIIDFKNFSGKIRLPGEKNFEFGVWASEAGEQIKGGSSINPFVQLKNQKRRFVEVTNRSINKHLAEGDIFNPFHLVRVVCFQGEVDLVGKVPANEELNFFIFDKRNFVEGILDIIDVTDKEVKLSEASFEAFKKVFRADQFKIHDNPFEDKLKEIASKSVKLDFSNLNDDQNAALTEVKIFLESSEQQVLVLQGTTNSGKSYLIPYIQEIAYNSGIQETEVFASSSRVAQNLLSAGGIENVNSIYSFIYGGQKTDFDEKEESQEEIKMQGEELEVSDEIPVEVVPLKNCDNSENALFIVDESQLVSDSYHQSIDLVFGTGYLLKDFINFSNVKKTKRKIVFIGDPYQLQLGKTDESPLNPAYLEESYHLKVSCFQLLDKEDISEIIKQALNCVVGIKSKMFNSLRFVPGNQLSLIANEEKLPCITDLIKNCADGHILVFSNEEAQKVNGWIKKALIKNGEDIAKDDLVLFNNNISVEDESDPFSEPKRIYNGQFGIVLEVSQNILPETVKIKGEPTTINFRELTICLNDTGHRVKILSLENYRVNPKAELSKNEIIAFKVILNTQLYRYIKEQPFEGSLEYKEVVASNSFQEIQKGIDELRRKLDAGEKVKGKLEEKEIEQRKLLKNAKRKHKSRIEATLRKDPSTTYYKYKNAALLRFGWAMTVHKSMSYKWEEVIFNVDPGGSFGKNNENHFRWLYTGISRARKKINLINFKAISPFDKTELRDHNSGVRPQDIFFNSSNPNPELRLTEFNEFVISKLPEHQFVVRNVEHLNWQERYFIKNGSEKEVIISFSYNGQGNFRKPAIIGGDKELSDSVVNLLKAKVPFKSFIKVNDLWRRKEYEKLGSALDSFDINFEQIFQTSYKDKIRFFSHENEMEVEVDYGGDGMVSFITAKYYSDVSIWDNFKNAVQLIKQ
jgi:hypothetical protein